MKRALFLLTIPLLLVLSSCSKNYTPFTENLKDYQNWDNEDLKSIQFYLSDDIVIQRKVSNSNSEIVAGKIKIENGKKVEEVIIPAYTPGILTQVDGKGSFVLRFENGEGRDLNFGPNPERNGKYVLLAESWNKKVGKVEYDGRTYYTSPESRYSFLMVDMRRKDNRQYNGRRAKGVTLD